MKRPVAFFYLGPPKTASTWLYHCLKDHPALCPTRSDETYFFDIHYAKGWEWYDQQFCDTPGMRIECTPTNVYNLTALRRILDHAPQARFALGLRHPVDRAFSAYWHVFKKGTITIPFSDLLKDYTWFRAFLETSLISEGLEFLYERAGRDRVHLVPFEGLKTDPVQTYINVLRFIGIDDTHRPNMLTQKINVAGPRQDLISRALYAAGRRLMGEAIDRSTHPLIRRLSGKDAYLEGIDPEMRATLIALCEPEIKKLENLTSLDLSSWRR